MKRMGWWLFNVLTILSLLFLLATATWAVRSYYFADSVFGSVPGRRWYQLESIRGGIEISVYDPMFENSFDQPHTQYEVGHRSHDLSRPNKSSAMKTNLWGFKASRSTYDGGGEGPGNERIIEIRALRMPYWSFTLLFILLPMANGCLLWKRGRAMQRGLCLRCGYDLRATPDFCPECGTVVSHTSVQ
jgi:hypothetical protein